MIIDPSHIVSFIKTEIIEAPGLNVATGARALGVTRQTLSALLNEHAGLSPDMALRLKKSIRRPQRHLAAHADGLRYRSSPQARPRHRCAAVRGGVKMTLTYAAFDPSEYLDNDATIAEYLSATLEDPNPAVFLAALGDVAKARGMSQIAKDAGLGRESLYKALSTGAHPRYETISAVLHALGVKFAICRG